MSTWKKYGGLSHVEAQNSISAYSLSVDLFTLRQAYFGTFDICGELHVSGNALVDHDVRSNNVTVQNDISCNQLFVKSTSNHLSDMYVTGNLSVLTGNVRIMNGNIDLSNNLYLSKKLFLGNSGVYLNGTDVIGNIGINTVAPKSALDFQSTKPFMLNVETTNTTNYSVLSKTGGGDGFIMYADNSVARLDFFVDGSANIGTTPDARLAYTPGGNFTMDVSSNTSILSNVSLSNRSNQTVAHIYGETVVIYDNSAGLYQYPAYQNANSTVGNALSLVANDASSIAFLNIVTPDKKGMAVGGGAYPNNQTRAMGTVGLVDTSGTYVPAIHLVDASSNIYRKFGLGINTYAPELDSYLLNINGSTHMKNGQLTITKQANIEIYKISIASTNTNYGIAIGSPYATDISFNDPTYKYRQKVYYTTNGGETWIDNSTDITNGLYNTTIEQATNGVPRYIHDVFSFDASLSFLCANGILDYSNSSGAKWYGISNVSGSSNYFSIYATASRVFAADTSGNVLYFNYTSSIYTDNDGIQAISPQTLSVGYTGTPYLHGYGTQLFLAAGNTVYQLNNLSGGVSFTTKFTNSYGSYRSLYTLDGLNAVAVGNSVITWTNNGFSTRTDINVPGTTFNSVHIVDASNAIAVGNSGVIQYTTNGYATWSVVSPAILNSSGNANALIDPSYNLTTVRLININQFYITKTITAYVSATTFGNTSLFHGYVPELFNNINNHVLDVSGSIFLSGDLNVNDGGRIRTNNSTFYLLDTCANIIHMGGDAVNVFIGNSVSSTTTVNSSLVTKQDASFNGNVVIGGKTQMLGNTTFTNSYVFSSYFDSANSDGSIYIAGLNSAQLGLPVNPGIRNVKIGNFNPTVDMSCNIYIGGASDSILLGGSVYYNSSLNIGPQIYINYLSMPNSSPHCGLYVGENGVKGAGYVAISNDMGGFVIKSTKTPNIIKLDVSNLIYNGSGSYNQGIVTLSKLTQGIGVDASYSIGVGTIDVSNVFLKNWALSSVASNLQTIDTSMSVLGNVAIGKSSFIANTTLDISGNVLVSSRLGVGNTTVNGSYVFDVLGDTNLGGNANITGLVSAMGNVAVNRSTATAGYAVDVSGNTNLTGNLVVSNGAKITAGNVALYNGNVCINRALANVGYALDVSGNANVSGNTTIAGGISATTAQTINFGTNAPSMYGNNIASGTISDAALTSNVMLLNAAQVITGTKYYQVPGSSDHVQFYNNNTPGQAGFIYISTADTIGYYSTTISPYVTLWSINYLGNFMTTGGISAKSTQTIDFSNNAPIMYGNNIATNTIPLAAINNLPLYANNTNSNYAFQIPSGSYTKQYQDLSGGAFNSALGKYSLQRVTSGIENTAVGYNSLPSLTTGVHNVTVGSNTLVNSNGSYNVAIGRYALTNSTSDNNTALGYFSYAFMTTGQRNVSVGANTGGNVLTGSYNTLIGYKTNTSGDYSYSTAVGYNSVATGNNQIMLGTSSETVYFPGGISATAAQTINFGTNAPTMYGTNIASGTVPDAALTSNVMLLNTYQTVTSTKAFNVSSVTDYLQMVNTQTINQSGYMFTNSTASIGYYSSTARSILWSISYDGTATIPKPIFPNNVSIDTQSTYNVLDIQSGHTFYVYGGVSTAFTLPSPNKCFYIFINGNTSNSITITCDRNGGLFLPYTNTTQTITLPPNTTATIRGNGSNWLLIESSFRNNITGINSSGNIGVNKSSASAGYALDVSGNTNVSGNLTVANGFTINFGTNAPTMYGSNIASGTIQDAALTSNIPKLNASNTFTTLQKFNTPFSDSINVLNNAVNQMSGYFYVNAFAQTGYWTGSSNNWYITSSGDIFTIGNLIASTPGIMINFGTNAPTMYGTNIATNTIPVAAINGLSTALAGINSTGTVGLNKSSASVGYALDVSGNTNVSGNFTVANGFTINFSNNAPTMYGNNIALGTIRPGSINGLSSAIPGINSTGTVGLNKSSASAGYALDVNGNTNVSGNLTVNNGFTVSAGTVSFPASSINPAAINSLSTAIPGINSTGTIGVNKVLSNSGYVLDTSGSAYISQGIWVGPPLTYINIAITPTSSTYSTSDINIFGFKSLGTINISKTNTVLNIPAGSLIINDNSFTYTPFAYQGNYTFTYTYNYSTLSNSPTMYIYPNATSGGYGIQYTLGTINGTSGTISTTIYLSNGLNGGLFAAALGGASSGTAISQTLSIKFQPTLSGTSFTYINSGLGVGNGLFINKAVITSGYALDVNGNVLATSYNASSDARLKTHIQPLSSTFDTIQKINAVSFDWKGNGKSDCGFIAQNVFEHLPNMCPDNWSADVEEPVDASGNPVYYSLDYGKMTPHLWGAVNDLIQDNRRLSQENASLKKRLDRIEAALGLFL